MANTVGEKRGPEKVTKRIDVRHTFGPWLILAAMVSAVVQCEYIETHWLSRPSEVPKR